MSCDSDLNPIEIIVCIFVLIFIFEPGIHGASHETVSLGLNDLRIGRKEGEGPETSVPCVKPSWGKSI
jgi:hypothetical protein